MKIKKSKPKKKISEQIKKKVNNKKSISSLWEPPKGSDKYLLSTGSTLVDLAISGRRFHGGGIPVGIFVEIFGQSSKGKTVMLLEMAGNAKRMGGDYIFFDPEARVNKQFAKIFDFELDKNKHIKPDTIKSVFDRIEKWEPEGKGPHVVFVDSLAALVSDEELSGDTKGYAGARRALNFSEGLRKICRLIERKDLLLIATNQVRQNMNTTPFAKPYKATGGEAPKFYASLRLELKTPSSKGKLTMDKTIHGVKHKRHYGIQTDVFVEKSSVAAPYQTGLLRIIFDYGVDDIVTNLNYLKTNLKASSFILKGDNIGGTEAKAVEYIEENELEDELRKEVIELWTEIQKELTPNRKKKRR